jgi:hypothetical protein
MNMQTMNFRLLFIVLLSITFCNSGHTQKKLIAMDEDLFNNSKPLKAKQKGGFRAVSRYEFGPYKIIAGKVGWGKTRSGSKLFGAHYEGSYKNKMSFVFVNDSQDTLKAQIAKESVLKVTDHNSFLFREIFKWNDYEVKKAQTSTLAEFITNRDTVPWSLVMVFPIRVLIEDEMQSDPETVYRGTLSGQDQIIDIRKVKTWQNGKKSFLIPAMGYELFLNEQSIAAVQVWPMNRQTVWIHDALNADLKFIVAGTIAALLLKMESHYDTGLDDFE